jgi:hypothetical protein
VFLHINASILSYIAWTLTVVDGGVIVGAVLGSFEEVERQDEEKGGCDPVAAHQQK